MIEHISRLAFQYRFWSWFVFGSVGLILWFAIPAIRFDQSVESFFPADHPALQNYQRSKASFGGDHLVYVAYDDPELWTEEGMLRVRRLADAISNEVPGILRVDALDEMPVPWKVDAAVEAMIEDSAFSQRIGRMLVGRVNVRLVTKASASSEDPAAIDRLRRRLCRHPLFNGLMVDADGTMTALIVRIGDPDSVDQTTTVRELRRVADAFAESEGIAHVAVAGPPVLVVDGFVSLDRDNRTLGVVAMLLMAVTMLIAVRNPAWALLPLLAGWTTWQFVRATITWFDLKLTLSSGPIIATTVVLCMPAAAHLAVRFREALQRGESRHTAAIGTLTNVFVPIAWCAGTAAVGYLATSIATTVRPVFQQGITMFVCNLMAGLLTFLLAAGAMGFGRESKRAGTLRMGESGDDVGFVAGRVGWLTDRILTRPTLALALFVLPIAVMSLGARLLEFESNYINIYKARSRVASDYRFVEDRMGGIGLVELLFPAPETVDPDWIDRLDEAAANLYTSDQELVSGVVSLADVLSLPPRTEASFDTDGAEPSRDLVLEKKLSILSRRRYANVLDNFWNRSDNTMRILCRVRESADADRKEACFERMLRSTRSSLSDDAIITGLSHIMTQITSAVVVTAFQSAAWATVMIAVMLWLSLRSLWLALLALVPTMLSVGLVLGVMGWLGLKIDMSTALVASVAIGLSVDDTFHCLLRWKHERSRGLTPHQALRVAYAAAGPGVILSSTAVSLGFLAMIVSEFVPTSNFAWLVSIATLGGSLGNLVVLPATLTLCFPQQPPSAIREQTSLNDALAAGPRVQRS